MNHSSSKYFLKIIAITCFGLLNESLLGQVESDQTDQTLMATLADGQYMDLDEYISGNPSSSKRIEMRDLDKPKQKLRDDVCAQCYFYYSRNDKRVKDAFAIVYQGELYFRVNSILNHMNKKDRRERLTHKDSFIHVSLSKSYDYLEAYFQRGGGISIGVGAGPVGVSKGGRRGIVKPVIFDPIEAEFNIIRNCKDLNSFLERHHPERSFPCTEKNVPLEFTRRLFSEI